jgi:hypothetical protein
MQTRRFLATILAMLSFGLILSAQAHAQLDATARSGVKVQPRFFNPFAVQVNGFSIDAFGQISSTPFTTQGASSSASRNLFGQANSLATAAASPGNGPPSQTLGNGPPSQTPGNGPKNKIRPPRKPFRPPVRSPFQPPGPPFDPPGPPFDPPGPPPVVPPPFQ